MTMENHIAFYDTDPSYEDIFDHQSRTSVINTQVRVSIAVTHTKSYTNEFYTQLEEENFLTLIIYSLLEFSQGETSTQRFSGLMHSLQ